jgi:hypothetical protein
MLDRPEFQEIISNKIALASTSGCIGLIFFFKSIQVMLGTSVVLISGGSLLVALHLPNKARFQIWL